MTTSAEQILALIGGYTDLKVYFEGARDDIDARLNLAEQRVGDTRRSFFIDQAGGDDANDGASPATPLASFEEAITRSVWGGALSLILMGDYTLSTRPTFRTGSVSITGMNNSLKDIYFANQIDGANINSPRFDSYWNTTDFFLDSIRLNSRVMAGHVTSRCMFSSVGMRAVTMYNCEIVAQPGDNLALLAGDGHGLGLALTNVVASAAMAGLWIDGVTAGTDPDTINRLAYTTLTSL